jgi:nucleoside-diphosphate-sugar epimerase
VDSLIPEYGGNFANIADIRDQVTVNISDVRDPFSMKYLIQGQDYLFNLAGQTSHMDSMRDPMTDLEINAKSQLSILEACRQHNPGIRVVFASTRQFYGKPDYLPVDERHPVRPVDINGIHKLAGEWYHTLYHQVYGLRTCALRLTNTYGPAMRIKDARQTFVGVWVRMILEGKPFEVWEGQQKRDFTYVDDCVEAMLLAATHPAAVGKAYNLGGLEVVSLNQLAELLVQANAGQGEYVHKSFPADRKRIDIGDYYASDALIRGELGWAPKAALAEGLRRTLAYFRERLACYI